MDQTESVMEYKIEFSGSPQFFKKASKSYWLHACWKSYFLYIGVPTVTLALCLTDQEIIASRTGDLVMGFLAGIAAFALFSFLFQLSRFYKTYPDEKSHDFVYRITDEEVWLQTELITSTYKWKVFKKLWRSPNGWMLIASTRVLVIPPETLNDELKKFITQKIIEVDGKIVR